MDKTGTELQSYIYNLLYEKILQLGFSERVTHVINSVIILIAVALLLFIVDYILRTIIRAIVIRFARKTKIK